ncbi:60S ribosomal protein L3 [Coprinopsis cinerea okayama7|uniref:Large ribosomal subunit protein mL44 n=1 Tax=Coprinopsis cinerea (strain Okayama-7 / 130 / ATCC MYA-4618 / FGSC 9003) TaxID=240176 RepID=A8N9K0_COPC7|nr:mitochondrial 54S ribosomal protein YmL3 [Coprinopsis cinerea okayama7\|eukprot:XP_001831506.1 mitochondrial 54S ribosomal protein YmL3 [Coprinopsis cinerea okayama7\
MGHVQKRLLSTVTKLPSVSPATLQKFPPREAFIQESDVPRPAFDPELWASLQPAPSSALSAFTHRAGLSSIIKSEDDIRQACTHPSFIDVWRQHYPREKRIPKDNAQLSVFGNSLMGLFAMEYLTTKYPYLPTRIQKAVMTAHVGPNTCASVATELGADKLLRWHRTPQTPNAPAVLHTDALASIPRAMTALIYKKHSLPSARQFVHSYFLSRQVDIRSMLKFLDPKKALKELVHKFGREPPKSRLLKETGRFSNTPVFVVGIFSGADQIGEGFGSSLKMAEFRAAEDALQRVFLTARPEHEIQLPSMTFPSGVGDVFRFTEKPESTSYKAPESVTAEIFYASAGRSRITPLPRGTPSRFTS